MEQAYQPEVFQLPFPADFNDEPWESMLTRASALCGAAEAIYDLAAQSGQPIQPSVITPEVRETSTAVFTGQTTPAAITTTAEALHLTALLQAYDLPIVQNANQLRNFCTNILIETAGDRENKNSDRLRAVEMIGKIKDVALFEERSTILVEHMTTEEIQKQLRDKVANLRSRVSKAVDVTPKE